MPRNTNDSKRKIQNENPIFDILSSQVFREPDIWERILVLSEEQLLAKNANDNNCIGLVYAIHEARKSIIDLLIERTPESIHAMDGFNRSILHHLVTCAGENHRKGTANALKKAQIQLPYIKILIEKGVDVHSRDNNGKTILMKAAELNNKEIIEIIITAAKEKLNQEQEKRKPQLTDLVKKQAQDELLRKLLEVRDDNGQTPLLGAVAHCSESAFSSLLAFGAERSVVNSYEMNILTIAADSTYSYFLSVTLLPNRGTIDVNAADAKSNTALYYAVKNMKHTSDRVEKLFKGLEFNKDSIRDLVKNGANIDQICSGRKIIDMLTDDKFKKEIQNLSNAYRENKMKEVAVLKQKALAPAADAGATVPSLTVALSPAVFNASAAAARVAALNAATASATATKPIAPSDKDEKTAADVAPFKASSRSQPDKDRVVHIISDSSDSDNEEGANQPLSEHFSPAAIAARAASATPSSTRATRGDDSPLGYSNGNSSYSSAFNLDRDTSPLNVSKPNGFGSGSASASASGSGSSIPPSPNMNLVLESPVVMLLRNTTTSSVAMLDSDSDSAQASSPSPKGKRKAVGELGTTSALTPARSLEILRREQAENVDRKKQILATLTEQETLLFTMITQRKAHILVQQVEAQKLEEQLKVIRQKKMELAQKINGTATASASEPTTNGSASASASSGASPSPTKKSKK